MLTIAGGIVLGAGFLYVIYFILVVLGVIEE
jgi:hypothetical protein